jgi:hypothetical protein
VMDYLRTRARERGRWYIGMPLAAMGFFGLAGIAWMRRRPLQSSTPISNDDGRLR